MANYQITQAPKFEVVDRKSGKYGVVTLPSSDGKREYRVDVTNQRYSCPAWIFSRERRVCKHLRALGYQDKPVQAGLFSGLNHEAVL